MPELCNCKRTLCDDIGLSNPIISLFDKYVMVQYFGFKDNFDYSLSSLSEEEDEVNCAEDLLMDEFHGDQCSPSTGEFNPRIRADEFYHVINRRKYVCRAIQSRLGAFQSCHTTYGVETETKGPEN